MLFPNIEAFEILWDKKSDRYDDDDGISTINGVPILNEKKEIEKIEWSEYGKELSPTRHEKKLWEKLLRTKKQDLFCKKFWVKTQTS